MFVIFIHIQIIHFRFDSYSERTLQWMYHHVMITGLLDTSNMNMCMCRTYS